jgi:hypothetical protein
MYTHYELFFKTFGQQVLSQTFGKLLGFRSKIVGFLFMADTTIGLMQVRIILGSAYGNWQLKKTWLTERGARGTGGRLVAGVGTEPWETKSSLESWSGLRWGEARYNLGFTSHSKDEAIEVKWFAHGHKRGGPWRVSNPRCHRCCEYTVFRSLAEAKS